MEEQSAKGYVIDPPDLPIGGDQAETYLREVESTYLDSLHERFPFWSQEPSTGLRSLLSAFDSFAVTAPFIKPQLGRVGTWQYLKAYDDGFSLAVEWAFRHGNDFVFPQHVTGTEIDQAGNLLNHAADYAQIAVFHKGVGKGSYSVTADPQNKVIRFARPLDYATNRSHLNFSDLIARHQSEMRNDDPGPVVRAIDERLSGFAPGFVAGRISPACLIPLLDESLIDLVALGGSSEIIPLPEDADMGFSSYPEFRRYWAALCAWSGLAIRIFMGAVRQGMEQAECMPTLAILRKEFIERMSHMTGMADEMVRSITDFLCLDGRTGKPDIFMQPLVAFGDTIAWSPLSVSLSRQPRNALKLICRTPATRDFGATLNGTRERPLLRRLGERLQSKYGYSFKLTTNVSYETKSTEVDLLAYTPRSPSEVLVVQAKTPIAADDVNEIRSATADMTVAQGQCAKAIAILSAMSVEQKLSLFKFVDWGRVTAMIGIVVTPDSEPDHTYTARGIPAISLRAFESRLRSRDCVSPSRLNRACLERDWQGAISSGSNAYHAIQIGEYRYEVPFDLHPAELKDRKEVTNGV